MNHQVGRFIDHEEVLIFVDDSKIRAVETQVDTS